MERKEESQLNVDGSGLISKKLRGFQNEALPQANHAEQHFLHVSLLG